MGADDPSPSAGAAGPIGPTRWVHAFEEDGPDGAVYRPEGEVTALSRRPRRRIELHADGTAVVADGGADDRLVGRAARFEWDGSAGVIRCADGTSLRIMAASADRLVVRTESG